MDRNNVKRYKLLLCAGEPEEEIVYAHLTYEEYQYILMDMRGEITMGNQVILDNGEIIDSGIIDDIMVLCDI